jgi:hypothetical protein
MPPTKEFLVVLIFILKMLLIFLGCFAEKKLFINILLAFIKTYFLILKNVP